eukprot:680974-Rhodomonas_salina.2
MPGPDDPAPIRITYPGAPSLTEVVAEILLVNEHDDGILNQFRPVITTPDASGNESRRLGLLWEVLRRPPRHLDITATQLAPRDITQGATKWAWRS